MTIERKILAFVAQNPDLQEAWADEDAHEGGPVVTAWQELSERDDEAFEAAMECASEQVVTLVTTARDIFAEVSSTHGLKLASHRSHRKRAVEDWMAFASSFEHPSLRNVGISFWVNRDEGTSTLRLFPALYSEMRKLNRDEKLKNAFAQLQSAAGAEFARLDEDGCCCLVAPTVDLANDVKVEVLARTAAERLWPVATALAKQLNAL